MKGVYIGLGFIKKTGTKNGDIVDSEKLGEAGFKKLKAKGMIIDLPKAEVKKPAPKKADSK